MNRKLVLLPALMLAATSLSGCVAVAIPALAGSAMVGSRVIDDNDDAANTDAAAAQPASTPASAPARAPAAVASAPAVIPAPTPASVPVPTATPTPTPAPAPAPAPSATPTPVAVTPPPPAVRIAAIPAAPPRPVASPAPPPIAPPPARAAPPQGALAAPPPAAAYPDPATPLTSAQMGFARFVRYGQASALGAKGGADLLSAMLTDPVALDGQRRRCAPGEQPVALIDLDPTGGIFAPPDNPARQPGLALGLAVMREAGVVIAWLSDMSVNQSGNLRTALEQSGLDPRGEDIIALRRNGDDGKQQRMNNLAGIACIVAIAGDDRADFDERFKYLRNPEAGAGLEPIIGDGWFLIEPIFPTQGQ